MSPSLFSSSDVAERARVNSVVLQCFVIGKQTDQCYYVHRSQCRAPPFISRGLSASMMFDAIWLLQHLVPSVAIRPAVMRLFLLLSCCISMGKGTGVVTSVPSDAPDDIVILCLDLM